MDLASTSGAVKVPAKKMKSKPMSKNGRDMVLNLLRYVSQTWPEDKYRSKKEMKDKTALIMGVNVSTVYRVCKQYCETEILGIPEVTKKRRKGITDIDSLVRARIRDIVYNFYLDGELPNSLKVMEVVNADESLPNFGKTSLIRILRDLKFKYIQRRGKHATIDRDGIALLRIKYLKTIKKFRQEKRPIYYLDETDVHFEPVKKTRRRSRYPIIPEPKEDGLIAVHIVSDTAARQFAFEAKQYQTVMNEKNFENWFRSVVSDPEPNAVLVMDNASYKSKHFKTAPNMGWRKDHIQKWLKLRGVSFEDNNTKAELLEKAKPVKDRFKVNVVLKNAGVEVLGLPPYVQGLSPIEEYWKAIKNRVAQLDTPLYKTDAIKILDEEMKGTTVENWNDYMAQVLSQEGKLENLDRVIDEILEENIAVTKLIDNGSPSEESSDSDVDF